VVVLPVDPRRGVIRLLPGRRGQGRLRNRVFLRVPRLLLFDQQVRGLPFGDLDAQMMQELGKLGFGHLAGDVPHPDQRLQRRAKLASIAYGQVSQVRALLTGRVPLLFGEAHQRRRGE